MVNIKPSSTVNLNFLSDKTIQIDGGLHPLANKLDKATNFLPNTQQNYLGEVLLAGSFLGAFQQSFQQILIDLLPKTLIGGAIRAKPVPGYMPANINNPNFSDGDDPENYLHQDKPNLQNIISKLSSGHYIFNMAIAIDETVVELIEYLAVYFMPTLFATMFAGRALGRITGTDFEFLGHPMHKYLKNIGKEVSVGKFKEKKLQIDNETLSKLALGKSMLYAMTVAFCSSLAFIVPSIRALIVNKLLGISDYSKLLGYKEKLSEDKDFDPIDNAKKNNSKRFNYCFIFNPHFIRCYLVVK